MPAKIAIDIGGTFTDVVVYDQATDALNTFKTLSDPDDLVRGIVGALRRVAADDADTDLVMHGSTVVINALIERRGAKTAIITTRGVRDIYEIGRINRPDSFNLDFERHQPLVSRDRIFEVDERIDAAGSVIRKLDLRQVEAVADELARQGIDAVAVVLLHAYRNAEHEVAVGDVLRSRLPTAYVTLSHEVSREYREFERTSTVTANAFVGPVVNGYLDQLAQVAERLAGRPTLTIMQSSGGLMDTAVARRQPVQMMESGPAGGVVGVIAISARLGIRDAIAFDMGGTTSKAAVIRDGRFPVAADYYVGGYNSGLPMRIPTLDIVEIGTGGGSIAWLDAAGGFHVGPVSAGAVPGPACYGRGGERATVTDAALVLGLLPAEATFGDDARLDFDAACHAVDLLTEPLGLSRAEVAAGVLRIATASMGNAVRAVTTARGLDPRDFALFAFGGNGPMVGAAVASELGIREVVIPPHPSVFSAVGMLHADLRGDIVQTHVQQLAELNVSQLEDEMQTLEAECVKSLRMAGRDDIPVEYERAADMRYVGQEHAVTVPFPDTLRSDAAELIKERFDQAHQERYSHSAPAEPAEIVSLRVTAIGRLARPTLPNVFSDRQGPAASSGRREVTFDIAVAPTSCEVFIRASLRPGDEVIGPALIDEGSATTVLRAGDHARLDDMGNICIEVAGGVN